MNTSSRCSSSFSILIWTGILCMWMSNEGCLASTYDEILTPFLNLVIPAAVPLRGEEKEVKVSVILPLEPYYKSSLMRVGPAILIAFEDVRRLEYLRHYKINLTYHDSHCSNMFAPLKAMTFAVQKSVDVFFGPSCELALAPVARFLKFWDTPLLTAGALTFDYSEAKTANDSEYFLTTRTGYGFKDMVEFVLSYFHRFHWRKVMLVYEKDDLDEVSGPQTCKLFMSTFVEYLKDWKWPYGNFDLKSNNVNATVKENLAKELGLKYSGKFSLSHHKNP